MLVVRILINISRSLAVIMKNDIVTVCKAIYILFSDKDVDCNYYFINVRGQSCTSSRFSKYVAKWLRNNNKVDNKKINI